MSAKTSLLPSWAIGGSQLGANSRAVVAPSIGVPVPPASTERAAGGRSEGEDRGVAGSGGPVAEGASAEGVANPTPEPPTPLATVVPTIRPSRSPACPLATHNDPSTWLETVDPNRPGWLRAVCTRCGVWIGSRPEEGGKGGSGRGHRARA